MYMQKRIISILGLFTVLLFLLAARTAYLQLWDGPNSGQTLAQKAVKYRSQAIPGEEYYRGEILDRNLQSLTDSGIRPTLVAFPASIKNVKETAAELEKLIGLEAEYTETTLKKGQESQGYRTPLILKANLDTVQVEILTTRKLPGIAVLPIKTRYGPKAVANHLIGHLNSISEKQWKKFSEQKRTAETNPRIPTAYKITDKMGVAGLEAKFEDVLKGSRPESRIIGIADANGQLLQGLGYKIQHDRADAWRNHLVLTLDRRYQEIVEKVMDEHIGRGAVVVLDIPTGDVLAIASRPNFNQNEVGKYLTGFDELIDRTQRVAFFPGSVFKMVVAAGVLEEHLLQPEETFTCTGTYTFPDGTEIKCLREHGQVTFYDAVSKSCNTTFVQLGLRLGNSKLTEYAVKLGFTVNINSKSPPAKLGNTSIGQQGVLVSPLQIANLYATLARNGAYITPRIVAEIRNHQGDVIQEFPNKPPVQVISNDTCNILKKALVLTAQSGSGKQAWVEEKGTGGKTGTAQANDKDKVIAWFAGFTPIENPRLAIAVMIEENEGGHNSGLRGGDNAAPVFKKIAEEIFKIDN
jgi:penicillin-binding protein 2